ncbi:MAG: hypothetical protein U0232_12555 [Thermomicrobiales bacterium]
MTAQTLDQPRVVQSPLLLAGWSTIVGGVTTIVLGIPLASFQAHEPTLWWVPLLNAVGHLFLLAGVIGLARAGAAGRGGLATGGLGLTLLGFATLTVAEIAWLAGSGAADVLYPVATLALLLGLVLTGVATLRAGRWGGWHASPAGLRPLPPAGPAAVVRPAGPRDATTDSGPGASAGCCSAWRNWRRRNRLLAAGHHRPPMHQWSTAQ